MDCRFSFFFSAEIQLSALISIFQRNSSTSNDGPREYCAAFRLVYTRQFTFYSFHCVSFAIILLETNGVHLMYYFQVVRAQQNFEICFSILYFTRKECAENSKFYYDVLNYLSKIANFGKRPGCERNGGRKVVYHL